jgi:predicted AlkP superfamily phosphohydrolase/phosphomutase
MGLIVKDRNKIIIIGLDSFDPDLLQKWSTEGRLPFLKTLMESGVWARLLSTSGIFPDSPWPSFNTGVSPAKHAYYNLIQLKRGTTEIIRVDARYCRYLPFWWLLRGAGKKAAIFDVPKTYPIEGIDGVQVAAWGEHYPLLKQSSLPPDLARELSARFGKYPHTKEIHNPKRISQEVKIYENIMRNIERKVEATQFLMAQEDWDLFVTVFGESHYAGHQFFHHFERTHWAHSQAGAARLSETLPNTYSELDKALAELFKGASDSRTIFIVSVHGIETNHSGNHLMPRVLEGLGYQVRAANEEKAGGAFGFFDLTRVLRNLIPQQIRDLINEKIVPQSFHDDLFAHQFSSGIDWKKTKAFFLPSDHFQGFISINLKGREPFGVVSPGAEYEEVCNQLSYELSKLVNSRTGNRAVRSVVQVSKIYQGKNLFNLPDIVIQWAEEGEIKQLHHPRFGLIKEDPLTYRKSQHTADGFMIAVGENINKNAVLNGASTMDLAPTILYLMGQEIPNDMDGQVLLDLVTPEFRNNNEVKYGERSLVNPHEIRF